MSLEVNVTKRFDGFTLHAAFTAGDTATALLGASGCGKSTLLKIIASLQSPTSGQIFFAGKDINELTPETYRQQVSYCAQTPALFGDSVYDNLVFPWQIRHKQPDPNALVADLLRFGLAENTLEKSVNELSGGEKQRVAFAVACMLGPRLLVLDEPTNDVDVNTIRALEDGLENTLRNAYHNKYYYNQNPTVDNVVGSFFTGLFNRIEFFAGLTPGYIFGPNDDSPRHGTYGGVKGESYMYIKNRFSLTADAGFGQAVHEPADAGFVHLDADEVLLGGVLGHLHQGGAHAEPDLQHHGCLAAKQGHHVERLWCEIDAHDRPELFQGLLLPFGQAAFATDEAADLAHELAVFVKYILGHRHNCLVISSIRVTEPGSIRV